MSRIRRKRKKSEILVLGVGALVGLSCIIVGAAGLALAHARELSHPAPAEKTQFSLTANDSGKTFTYTITSRFSVFLDEAHYPLAALRCSPDGIVGSISNIGVPPQGLWVARFEAVAPGSCVLRDKDFAVTIVVE